MKIITFNINGLRAALRKGLDDFLNQQNADIVFLQEIRVQSQDIDISNLFCQYPYKSFNYASKPGYSGTAILSKHPLTDVYFEHEQLRLCDEGRYIFAKLENGLNLINVYLPSGTSSHERQDLKLETIKALNNHLKTLKGPFLLSGDMNLTRTDKDLKNFKGNKEKPGCTTIERQLFSNLLTENKLIDCHRTLEPDNDDIYTWWTYRGQAFQKNVGWRIDYHFISQSRKNNLQSCQVLSSPRISDHAAVVVQFA